MNLRDIMLTERSRSQKSLYYMALFVLYYGKRKTAGKREKINISWLKREENVITCSFQR